MCYLYHQKQRGQLHKCFWGQKADTTTQMQAMTVLPDTPAHMLPASPEAMGVAPHVSEGKGQTHPHGDLEPQHQGGLCRVAVIPDVQVLDQLLHLLHRNRIIFIFFLTHVTIIKLISKHSNISLSLYYIIYIYSTFVLLIVLRWLWVTDRMLKYVF